MTFLDLPVECPGPVGRVDAELIGEQAVTHVVLSKCGSPTPAEGQDAYQLPVRFLIPGVDGEELASMWFALLVLTAAEVGLDQAVEG